MDEILEDLDEMLDDFVYRKIWSGLSGKDKEFLRHMTDEPIQTKVLCEKTGMSLGVYSRYRERLIRQGLILSPQYGYVELALPRFSRVIRAYI